MAEILVFPKKATAENRGNSANDGRAVQLRSALDEVGKTLADLLLALLTELEDSSLRLSLVIERSLGESERRVLRAEQQEIRATIAELRQVIGNQARSFGRASLPMTSALDS